MMAMESRRSGERYEQAKPKHMQQTSSSCRGFLRREGDLDGNRLRQVIQKLLMVTGAKVSRKQAPQASDVEREIHESAKS